MIRYEFNINNLDILNVGLRKQLNGWINHDIWGIVSFMGKDSWVPLVASIRTLISMKVDKVHGAKCAEDD